MEARRSPARRPRGVPHSSVGPCRITRERARPAPPLSPPPFFHMSGIPLRDVWRSERTSLCDQLTAVSMWKATTAAQQRDGSHVPRRQAFAATPALR